MPQIIIPPPVESKADVEKDAAAKAAAEIRPLCHRSWLAISRPAKQTAMVPGAKGLQVQEQTFLVNVGTMYPCFGSACMMWDEKHKVCLDRSEKLLAMNREVTAPPPLAPVKEG